VLSRHSTAAESSLSGLIGLAYDAAAAPGIWDDFLAGIGEALDLRAANAAVSIADNEGDFATLPFTWHRESPNLEDYTQHYGQLDPFRTAAARLPVGTVCNNADLVPDAELLHTEYFNDFYSRIGLRHGAVTILHNEGGRTSGISCHRGPDQEPLGSDDLAFLGRLSPHLIRARNLSAQLAVARSQRQIVSGVLDRLPVGIFFVDAASQVVRANEPAERLLRAKDGLEIRRKRLVGSRMQETRALHAVVATACDPEASLRSAATLSTRLGRPSGRRDLGIMAYGISPESRMWGGERAAAFVVVTDGEAEMHGAARRLRELYGLSITEADLAVSLAGGLTLKEIAAARGVSVETVRWQLKQAFAKTGTARQPELTRLVLLGPALIS